MAAQVAHVLLMAIERARYITVLAEAMVYFRTGENQIYGLRILRNCLLKNHAQRTGLPVASVRDSGMTQIPSVAVTSIGIS
jgi:peptidyl-tRNA hydrolase